MRIILTGTSPELPARLAKAGFVVVECPLVRIESIEGPPIQGSDYDWLVLTSRHGVEHVFERLEGAVPKVAVIGPGTAAALRGRGIEPALIAAVSTQEGLVAEFPRPPGRVLFAGAAGARETLQRELGADFVPLYRTVELELEEAPRGNLAVIASTSAARALAATGTSIPCVSIGPVTSAEARRHGLDVVAEATSHDLEGLVRVVKLAASQAASSPS
jgi:uroporphyrinogen III methyltransferase/synthase